MPLSLALMYLVMGREGEEGEGVIVLETLYCLKLGLEDSSAFAQRLQL